MRLETAKIMACIAVMLGMSCAKADRLNRSTVPRSSNQNGVITMVGSWTQEQFLESVNSCESYHTSLVTIGDAKTVYCECLMQYTATDLSVPYTKFGTQQDQVFNELEKRGQTANCRLEAGLAIDPATIRWNTQYVADENVDKAVLGVTGQSVADSTLFFARALTAADGSVTFDLYRRPLAQQSLGAATLVATGINPQYFAYETFASGNAVASWNSTQGDLAFLSYYDAQAKTWSAPQPLGTGFQYLGVYQRDISIDAAGNIVVGWVAIISDPDLVNYPSQCFFQFFHKASNTWAPTILAPQTECSSTQVAWNPDGSVMVMVVNGGQKALNAAVEYSIAIPEPLSRFSEVVGLTSASEFKSVDDSEYMRSDNLILNASGSGKLSAAWVRTQYKNNASTLSQLYVGIFDSDSKTWTVSENLGQTIAGRVLAPAITTNKNGDTSLFWNIYTPETTTVYTARYTKDAGWSLPAIVTQTASGKDAKSITSTLATNNVGEISYSWVKLVNGAPEIWSAFSKNGQEFFAQKISDSAQGGTVSQPVATLFNDGQVFVGWEQSKSAAADQIGFSLLSSH